MNEKVKDEIDKICSQYDSDEELIETLITNTTPSGKILVADNMIIKALSSELGLGQNEFLAQCIHYYLESNGISYDWNKNIRIKRYLQHKIKKVLLELKENSDEAGYKWYCIEWKMKPDTKKIQLELLSSIFDNFGKAAIRRMDKLLDIREMVIEVIDEIESKI